VPINARSCKHLKSLLGEKYEEARMKFKNPDGPPAKGKPVSKAKAKKLKKAEDDHDNEEEDDEDAGKGEGAPALLLANKWDLEKGADPTGWWISEKLDGVRYVSAIFACPL
jgi:DNA ligase-1